MILPTTISRYIIAELTKIFLVSLTALVLLLVLVGVVQESIRNGLPLNVALRIIPYVLPNALCFAIPGTILYTACSVYGRMSAANEITALKAAGISPLVALRPVLISALLLSMGTVWLIDIAFSWGHAGVKRALMLSVEEIAYSVLSSQGHYSCDQFSCSVVGVEGDRLLQPVITIFGKQGGPTTVVSAREATLNVDAENGDLRLTVTDGVAKIGDQATLRFADSIEQVIQLSDGSAEDLATARPAHMRISQMPAATKNQNESIKRLQGFMAIEAALQMTNGNFFGLSGSQWDGREQEIENGKRRLSQLKTEPQRRWASGFSCFCFALIGAPLAIQMRTADRFTIFGVCFLPILVVYYPFFAYGLDQAKSGALPPYAVWLANGVSLCAGAWLVRKVVMH